MLKLSVAAIIGASTAALSLAAIAQGDVFVDAQARSAPALEDSHIRTRVVRLADTIEAQLRADARAATVRMNLFEDAAYDATTNLLEILPDGDMTWRGVFEGGYATLVRRGGETAGLVRDGATVYEVVPMGGGMSRVTEVHVDALPGCGVNELTLPANPLAGEGLMAAIERTLDAEDAQAGDAVASRGSAAPTLDQLVAYTPNALAWVGGTTSGMSAFIDNAILDMNTVLVNSGIEMETRVVYKHPLTENETGSGVTDRDDFRLNGDGKWDEIHQLRDDFGADIGHILVRDSNVCGIAAQIYRGASNGDQLAFCLTAMSCVSNLTFVHEVGHVIGCAHDVDNAGGPGGAGTFSYSFGWYDPDDTPQWHTVMSYSPGFPSQRVPYFSTPNVVWSDGNPLGDAALADNARTINLNIPDITGWRGSVGLAPTSFEVVTRAGENVITWEPIAQATGYEVWRGLTADVGASSLRGFRTTPAYTDTSIAAGQTYFYFVRSRFADGGSSPYSSPIEVLATSANPADLSGDGVVDSVDLAMLIGSWGTPGADLSGDGTTDSTDLAILVSGWG